MTCLRVAGGMGEERVVQPSLAVFGGIGKRFAPKRALVWDSQDDFSAGKEDANKGIFMRSLERYAKIHILWLYKAEAFKRIAERGSFFALNGCGVDGFY